MGVNMGLGVQYRRQEIGTSHPLGWHKSFAPDRLRDEIAVALWQMQGQGDHYEINIDDTTIELMGPPLSKDKRDDLTRRIQPLAGERQILLPL